MAHPFPCRRNSWNSSGSESEGSDFESESERPLNSRRPIAAAGAAANRRPAKTVSKARPAPAKRVPATQKKGKYQSSDESGSDYSEEERRKYGGGR